jgi:heme exporter protein D
VHFAHVRCFTLLFVIRLFAARRNEAGASGLIMETVNHFSFIAAAYIAAVLVVCGLTAWVMLDYRVQRRHLCDLESKGVTRRSATPRLGPNLEKAKEDVSADESAE